MARLDVDLEPLPFDEAARRVRERVPLSSVGFKALSDDAKQRAFAVAGVAREDIAALLLGQIAVSVERGESFEDFKRVAAQITELTISKNRLRNTYTNALMSAYQGGRWVQIQRVAQDRPFLQYDAIGDSRTRPAHAAMDGLVYSADDPFWREYFPPNGYGCRCSVFTLTERQVKARGITVRSMSEDGERGRPRDGKGGVLFPDPGFRNNPARFGDALAAINERTRRNYRDDERGFFEQVIVAANGELAPLRPDPDLDRAPPEFTGEDDAEKRTHFMRSFRIDSRTGFSVIRDPAGYVISTESSLFDHIQNRARWFAHFAATLEAPQEIRLKVQISSNRTVRITRQYYRVFVDPSGKLRPVEFAVSVQRGAMVSWTVLTTDKVEKRRKKGMLIWSR